MFVHMDRTEKIVRLAEFLDRNRGRLLSLPGVTDVGVGPRMLDDSSSDVVVQIFVRSRDDAPAVREHAVSMLEPEDIALFVRGQLEPLTS
jgi:hypothetical protein